MTKHEPQRPFRVRNVAEQPAAQLKGDAGPPADIAARVERMRGLADAGRPLFAAGSRDGAVERGERVEE